MTSRTFTLIALGLAAVPACSSHSAPPKGTSCADDPDPHCANAIDAVVVPMLRARGLPIRDAKAPELCRRLAVDLLDRLPTEQEQAACEAQSPEERVDTFMATDDYVRSQRRLWAFRAGHDDLLCWWRHIVEMDELAGRLAKGELGYADFVGQLVVHPGFYGRHYGDDWAKAVVRIAFDREARDDEVAALRPLTHLWGDIGLCDGASYWVSTTLYGVADDEVDADRCEAVLTFVDPCACQYFGGCRSTAFGGDIDFDVVACDPEQSDSKAGMFLATPAMPDGTHTTCPDGSVRPECADRELDDGTGIAGAPFGPMPMLDDAARARLAVLGQTLAGQYDFWEAAADRELRRLLGWWKSGFKQPEWDVPAVRRQVAAELWRTGSLRAAQKLILTSLLYEQPSAPPATKDGEDPPAWSVGPVKLLSGDAWLDSVGIVVGETVGRCDFRFLSDDDFGLLHVDPNQVDQVATTLGDAFMGEELAPLGDGLRTAEAYELFAKQLGGCTNNNSRAVASSVGIVAAQRDLAQRLCAAGRGVTPEGLDPADTSDASLDAVTTHLVHRALGRAPAADERSAFRNDMRACLAAGAGGCADAASAARWLCQRIVDSAEMSIY